MERSGRPWFKSLSKEKVLEKTFDSYTVLSTNLHIPLFKDMYDKMFADYLVTATFKHKGYNGDNIICNGRVLIHRPKKFEPIVLSKGVELLEGNPTKIGGSHNHPAVTFEDMQCKLRFVSNGLPIIEDLNGWAIKIHSIERF